MIDPARALDLAAEMQRVYGDAEILMLDRVKRRLERGIDRPGWAELKLRQIQAMRHELDGVVSRLEREGAGLLPELVRAAHAQGVRSAAHLVGDAPFLPRANPAAVTALVTSTVGRLQGTHFAILRLADDAYRQTIAEAAGLGVTGAVTRREAAQAALRRFADRGVTGFVDKAGRSWDLGSYVEMATRSSIGQAHLEGHVSELRARGRDLVIVSNSPDECYLCRPWEGKVLSLSGDDPDHPSLAEARAGGLFHASCTHSVGLYVEGLTRPMRDTADPEGRAERDRHRELERHVRHWRRRQAAAITPLEQRRADAKVKEWRDELAAFTQRTGRRRDFGRESIRTAAAKARVSTGDRIQDALEFDAVVATDDQLAGMGINTTMAGRAGDVDIVIKPRSGLDQNVLRMGIEPATDLEREQAALLVRRFLDDPVDTPRISIRDVPGHGESLILERRRHNATMSPLETPRSERISAGLFDSVIGNTDRHFGNVLVDTSGRRPHLILIDHGLAFPRGVPTWGNMKFLRGDRLRVDDRRRLQRLLRQEGEIRVQLEPLVGAKAVDEVFRRTRYMLQEGRQLLPSEFGTRPWQAL